MVALTIGMATYKDFDGVYFTIQALRMYQDMTDTELLVVDNFGDDHTRDFVQSWAKGRYVLATDAVGTAAPRDRVFREAAGDAVLCCDSHVLLVPGAVARLREYYRAHPGTRDLLQGPLIYDDLENISTHFAPEWRGQMWGTWATDERGKDPEGAPFDIPMQGLGLFSCRREAWAGFNPQFRGFGGEEGYIHEKMRQRGGRTLCLPWLRWTHRFGRPAGVPYPLYIEDKLRNYIIGHSELGLDLAPIIAHFEESLPPATVAAVTAEALALGAGSRIEAEAGAGITPAGGADEVGITPAEVNPPAGGDWSPPPRVTVTGVRDRGGRRAIVCSVEDNPELVQPLLALRQSWSYVETVDTDLVAIGPAEALRHLPDDLVKIEQRLASDDPVWDGHPAVNAIACLNGAGADRLDQYTHLLRTDVDAFITPAWNAFHPDAFTFGEGGYVNDDDTRRRIREIAALYGLAHRGIENIHSTWYGPTAVVRRVGAVAEMLTKHILTHHFADDDGEWPGWYRGVAAMYASEIAVNHCAPDARRSDLLDASNTSDESTARYPHVYCWHPDESVAALRATGGRPSDADTRDLDIGIIWDYCRTMSFWSLAATVADSDTAHDQPPGPVLDKPTPDPFGTDARSHSNGAAPKDRGLPTRMDAAQRASYPASMPLVSCLCATYNRPPSHQHLIEEAIESFLRQDYPNKELVVINDGAGQELLCDAPGVRIVNVDDRFPTLGEKYNAAADLARGALLAPWDDDDISLPWRLSLSVERLGDAAYFNPRRYWFLDPGGLHFDHTMGYAHNASLVTRDAFEAVGRYTSISVGYDAAIDAALWSRFEDAADPNRGHRSLTRAEWFYIYRWGVSPGHVSVGGSEENYRVIGERPVAPGRFHLSPAWRSDYVADTRRLLDEPVAASVSPDHGATA